MNDPIVDEVRRVREAYAARFNYDLDAMIRDIKQQEQASGQELIRYVPADSGSKTELTARRDRHTA